MTEYQKNTLNAIRMKCLHYPINHPIARSSNVAFRDLFDPYCAEYKEIDNETRLDILREMMEKGIITSLLTFHKTFQAIFEEKRLDIANAAADGMALLLDHVLVTRKNEIQNQG